MSKFGEYRINNMAREKIWPPYKYQNGKKKWLSNNYSLLCFDNIHGLYLVSGWWEHVWPKQISYWQKPYWATLTVQPTLTTCTTYTRTCFPLIVAPVRLTVIRRHDASDIFQFLSHLWEAATQRFISVVFKIKPYFSWAQDSKPSPIFKLPSDPNLKHTKPILIAIKSNNVL